MTDKSEGWEIFYPEDSIRIEDENYDMKIEEDIHLGTIHSLLLLVDAVRGVKEEIESFKWEMSNKL
jgi:hypothetical protein